MALAATLRMKARDIQPATGGRDEVVELEEVFVDSTNNTLHRLPQAGPAPAAHPLKLNIDLAASQGLFLKGRHYKVEFTLIAVDGIL